MHRSDRLKHTLHAIFCWSTLQTYEELRSASAAPAALGDMSLRCRLLTATRTAPRRQTRPPRRQTWYGQERLSGNDHCSGSASARSEGSPWNLNPVKLHGSQMPARGQFEAPM